VDTTAQYSTALSLCTIKQYSALPCLRVQTQRARLKVLAKMPVEELHRTMGTVLRGSVLASPALRRRGGGREGEEGGESGVRAGEEAEVGPMARHLAAVTEEEA